MIHPFCSYAFVVVMDNSFPGTLSYFQQWPSIDIKSCAPYTVTFPFHCVVPVDF